MKPLKRLTKNDWRQIAVNSAEEAYEKNFPSRRGLFAIKGAGIVYYDNNPFALPRKNDPREDVIAEIRASLKRADLKEKACAYWPMSGESKDYTFAMVIEADDYMIESIHFIFDRILNRFMKGL